MKKKLITFVLSAVLALSMVGCTSEEPANNDGGGSSTGQQEESQTADLMDKDTYLSEVEGLNTATYELMQVWASMTEDFDFETAIPAMRECKEPFVEFSKIDNPPEGYEEAHTRMAEASTRFGVFIDQYADFFQDVEDGVIRTDEEYTEKSEALMTEMEASTLELSEAMKEVQEIQ